MYICNFQYIFRFKNWISMTLVSRVIYYLYSNVFVRSLTFWNFHFPIIVYNKLCDSAQI